MGIAEHLDHGVCACRGEDALGADICSTWEEMLRRVYPDQYAATQPDFHLWHQRFRQVVDKIAEEGYRLLPLARHVATGLGLAYPTPDDLDFQYIRQLEVPGGGMPAEGPWCERYFKIKFGVGLPPIALPLISVHRIGLSAERGRE